MKHCMFPTITYLGKLATKIIKQSTPICFEVAKLVKYSTLEDYKYITPKLINQVYHSEKLEVLSFTIGISSM